MLDFLNIKKKATTEIGFYHSGNKRILLTGLEADLYREICWLFLCEMDHLVREFELSWIDREHKHQKSNSCHAVLYTGISDFDFKYPVHLKIAAVKHCCDILTNPNSKTPCLGYALEPLKQDSEILALMPFHWLAQRILSDFNYVAESGTLALILKTAKDNETIPDAQDFKKYGWDSFDEFELYIKEEYPINDEDTDLNKWQRVIYRLADHLLDCEYRDVHCLSANFEVYENYIKGTELLRTDFSELFNPGGTILSLIQIKEPHNIVQEIQAIAATSYFKNYKPKKDSIYWDSDKKDFVFNESKFGYVYLIQAEGTNRIKIGCSKDPQQRLAQIKSPQQPFKLKLLASIFVADCAWYEKFLHNLYKEYRIYGEWFEIPFVVKDWNEHGDQMVSFTDCDKLPSSLQVIQLVRHGKNPESCLLTMGMDIFGEDFSNILNAFVLEYCAVLGVADSASILNAVTWFGDSFTDLFFISKLTDKCIIESDLIRIFRFLIADLNFHIVPLFTESDYYTSSDLLARFSMCLRDLGFVEGRLKSNLELVADHGLSFITKA